MSLYGALALAIEPTHIPQRQLIAERFSTFAIVFAALNLILSTRAGVSRDDGSTVWTSCL